MIGAIAGDIIGSRYEGSKRPPKSFRLFANKCQFTDDTTLTAAVANSIMSGESYADSIRDFYFYYPNAGYGSAFKEWARSESKESYGSWGNGSAMRVSPVVWVAKSGKEVLQMARDTAMVTHDHPEGIVGAQAIAFLAFLAKSGHPKETIKMYAEDVFPYDMKSVKEEPCILECSCHKTVPKAIHAFLYSSSFEDAIRRGVRMGGDSDTIAAMAGTIAEHFYGGVPRSIKKQVFEILDKRIGNITVDFYRKYVDPNFDPEVEIKDPVSCDDGKDLVAMMSSLFTV